MAQPYRKTLAGKRQRPKDDDDFGRGFEAGFQAAQEALHGDEEDRTFTREQIASMTTDEINANWDEIAKTLERGR